MADPRIAAIKGQILMAMNAATMGVQSIFETQRNVSELDIAASIAAEAAKALESAAAHMRKASADAGLLTEEANERN